MLINNDNFNHSNNKNDQNSKNNKINTDNNRKANFKNPHFKSKINKNFNNKKTENIIENKHSNENIGSEFLERGFKDINNYISTTRITNNSVKIKGQETSFDLLYKNKYMKKIKQNSPTKIYALGGIEEIGKNMYCVEFEDEILIVDCGIKFANKKELPGISGIIPSFGYLKENEQKIKALIITHGHEDHIGGIPYLLKFVKIPLIYSPVIASELIKRKISEHKNVLPHSVEIYSDNSVFQTKHFLIDFYRVNHSIPDSFGLSIATPNGLLATSGDFRFDFSSHSDKTNLNKISTIAKRNVDVLLCESTNAENTGFNESEENILKELNNIISSARGRILISSFASNLGRVEEIIRIAIKRNRKTVIIGRSMDSNVSASRKVGYLKFDDNFLLLAKDIDTVPDNQVLIICTGSQGEETAALNTIAKGKHAWIKLKPTDTIILSSNAIPGNFSSVEEMINRLSKYGAEIFVNGPNLKIHSSGHAAKLEQQLFINVMNPKFLVPIHGEYKMLRALQKNCVELGMKKENIIIISNGQVLHLLNGNLFLSDEEIDATEIYIDGQNATLTGDNTIKIRFELGEKGIIAVGLTIDFKQKILHSVSSVVTAGSFYAYESIDLFKKIMISLKMKIEEMFKTRPNITKNEILKIGSDLVAFLVWKAKNKRPFVKLLITDLNEKQNFDQAIKPGKIELSNENFDDVPENSSENTL